MNRREFLQGAASVAALAVVPLRMARGAVPFWTVTYHRNPRRWSTHVLASYTVAHQGEALRRVTWVECGAHWLERNRIKAERMLARRVLKDAKHYPAVLQLDGSWTRT